MKTRVIEKVDTLADEQLMSWRRAVLAGAISALFMALFVDIFFLLGVTPFSFETYIGSILRGTPYGHLNWTIGFPANLIMGSIFGLIYGYAFENARYRSQARFGAALGLAHAMIAAIAVFPFFNTILAQLGMELFPRSFGFLGAGLGFGTFAVILIGHVLFGLSMGTFYGPIGEERLHSRFSEPGEMGRPGERGIITQELDPEDKVSA